MSPKKDLRRADAVSTAALNRQAIVTIPGTPPITGRLDAITGLKDRVRFTLMLGHARGIFEIPADTIIEVHRQEPGP